MTPFKTQQEIWKHLIDGGKVIHKEGVITVSFIDGALRDNYDKHKATYNFHNCAEWLPYHEPIKLEFIADIDTIQRTADESNRVTGINLNLKDHLVIDYDIKAPARFKVTMTELVGEG